MIANWHHGNGLAYPPIKYTPRHITTPAWAREQISAGSKILTETKTPQVQQRSSRERPPRARPSTPDRSNN